MSIPDPNKTSNGTPVKNLEFKHRAPDARIQQLLDLMASLRAADGCPWDRAQSFESLLPYLQEESAEYIDAVREGDMAAMKEELGDVLLQVVFHAQIAQEQDAFDLQDVIDGLVYKLWSRHPHVFGDGDESADNASDVEAVWAKKKREERAARGEAQDANPLHRVARSLPPLARARELSKSAAKVGFDFENATQVLDKIDEELDELREAMTSGDRVHTEEEVGDVLMSVANLARTLGVDPDAALARTNQKFVRRFDYVADAMTASNLEMNAEHFDEMQKFWDEARAKRVERTVRRSNDPTDA